MSMSRTTRPASDPATSASTMSEAATGSRSHLDLLTKALTMSLWSGKDGSYKRPPSRKLTTRIRKLAKRALSGAEDPAEQRDQGRDWPLLAHTMIGTRRMENLRDCVESVIRRDVPGDLIETGAWRGGACILMLPGACSRPTERPAGASGSRTPSRDYQAGCPKYPADAGTHHTVWASDGIARGGQLKLGAVSVTRTPGLLSQRLVQGHPAERANRKAGGGSPGWRYVRIDDGRPDEPVSEAVAGRILDCGRLRSDSRMSPGGRGLSAPAGSAKPSRRSTTAASSGSARRDDPVPSRKIW